MIPAPKLSPDFRSKKFSSSDALRIQKAACTTEESIAQIKNIRLTVEEKINTRNIGELNQSDDGLA